MKMTDEVKAALQTLRDNVEHDFERYWIDRLESDLIAPPRVEVVDEKNQVFKGIKFRKRKEGHYFNPCLSIYRTVWIYYYGEVPAGTLIHHRDENKDNNDIENLEPKTPIEHRRIHSKTQFGDAIYKYHCEVCGAECESKSPTSKYCAVCRKVVTNGKAKARARAKANKPPREIKSGMRTCPVCGNAYYFDSNSHYLTCSPECGKKLGIIKKYEKRKKVCPICGKTFVPLHKCTKTCSDKCGRIMRRKTIEAQRLESGAPSFYEKIKCELCGKEFEARKTEHQRFCSASCRSKANIKKAQAARLNKNEKQATTNKETVGVDTPDKENHGERVGG